MIRRRDFTSYLLANYDVVKHNSIAPAGTSLNEVPGGGANDTVTGFTVATDGQPNGLPYFDATQAGFVQTGLTSLDINNKTFIVAYRPSADALAASGPYVLRWFSATGNELRIYSTSIGSFNVLYVGDSVSQLIAGSADDWVAETDYLLVLSIPGAGEVLRFYSNGEEIGNLTITNATVSTAVNAIAAGVGAITNAGTSFCDGLITTLTIINKALSAEEVREIYHVWSA